MQPLRKINKVFSESEWNNSLEKKMKLIMSSTKAWRVDPKEGMQEKQNNRQKKWKGKNIFDKNW